MKLSKPAWFGIAAGAVVAGGALSLVLLRGPRVLAVGDKAPTFTLQQASAGALTFRDDGHHVTLVNFWATWCPPCVMETPSLEKFAKQVAPLGVRVIGVSVDQDQGRLERFISQYGITYPVLRDPYQSLAGRFGTSKFPETYIFDRNGRLADKIIGATDWDDPQMTEFVKALVHWPPPASAAPAAASGGNW